jgi:D-glycero-D-manno-heptose 1,7-bisphosphate phosphatase
MPQPTKLIVIDRDGVLSQAPEAYVRGPEDWQPQPGSLEAVARLNQAGWRVVVATNQSGIGRGLFDIASFNAFNHCMHKALADAGARIEAVFFCPHAPEEDCECRKPAPGLFLEIGRRFGVTQDQVLAAGDSACDAQAAANAGCMPHLILSGKSAGYRAGGLPEGLPPGTHVHRDLQSFADWVLAQESWT